MSIHSKPSDLVANGVNWEHSQTSEVIVNALDEECSLGFRSVRATQG